MAGLQSGDGDKRSLAPQAIRRPARSARSTPTPLRCGALSVGVGLAIVGAALASGCSLAFEADAVQCRTTPDCTARGGAFVGSVCIASVCATPDASPRKDATSGAKDGSAVSDAHHDATVDDAREKRDAASDAVADAPVDPRWACLGHVQYPEASTALEALTIPYINLLSNHPIPGIRAQACLKLDPTCDDPVSDAGVTNEAGLVTLSVPSGYDGYIQSLWEAGLPSLVYISPPIFKPTTVPAEFLLSKQSIDALAFAVRAPDGGPLTLDPNDGIAFLGSYDCQLASASGVSFSISPSSPSSTIAYVIGGNPSTSATETDNFGSAAIVNVPPGSITITATLAATEQVIGTATGFVQAGVITFLSLPPTPSP
jgi:hypothetical protein